MSDKIVRQAFLKSQPDVCVSWWESGRVTRDKSVNHYGDDGTVSVSICSLPNLPDHYPYRSELYFQAVESEASHD